MNLPPEIESLIKQYAQPCAATTRPNWEQGSSIIEVLKHDRWWEHYNYDRLLIDTFIGDDEETVAQDTTNTWYAWCKYKRIIGPPRCVSSGDIEQLDCDYLYITGGLARHYIPWTRTWFGVSEMALRQKRREKEQGVSLKGDCINISEGVPNWAIREFRKERPFVRFLK